MGSSSNAAWSGEDLAEVAQWQKYVIWLVLVEIQSFVFLGMKAARLSAASADLPGFVGLVLYIAFSVFCVYFVYNLARSVRERAAILYAILALTPGISILLLLVLNSTAPDILRGNEIMSALNASLVIVFGIGILVLLVLNNTATGILRGNGIRVGLKGANPADLALKQSDNTPAPRVDKLRIVAFTLIVAFLLVVALATMSLIGDIPVRQVQDDLDTRKPGIAVIGHPGTHTRVIIAVPPRMRAPSPAAAPVPPVPGAAPTPFEPTPGRPVIVADTTITIGTKTIIRANSPRTKYAVLFEDDGETGYFYGLDRENSQNPVLDKLHIYDVASVKERTKPYRVQIIWSADGMQSAISINHYPYAVFDFEARRAYCRTGSPAPNQQFTRYSHEWSDDALRFFK